MTTMPGGDSGEALASIPAALEPPKPEDLMPETCGTDNDTANVSGRSGTYDDGVRVEGDIDADADAVRVVDGVDGREGDEEIIEPEVGVLPAKVDEEVEPGVNSEEHPGVGTMAEEEVEDREVETEDGQHSSTGSEAQLDTEDETNDVSEQIGDREVHGVDVQEQHELAICADVNVDTVTETAEAVENDNKESDTYASDSSHTADRDDALDPFQGHSTEVYEAMNTCKYELQHLLRNTESLYPKAEDFTLPSRLCKSTLDLVKAMCEVLRNKELDRTAGQQAPDGDTIQEPQDLAWIEPTLAELVEKPLTMLEHYVGGWKLRVVEEEGGPKSAHTLDPDVPSPERADMEAVIKLHQECNMLHTENAELKLLVQEQAAATQPNTPERKRSWDWQQATRVCASCRTKFQRQQPESKGEEKAHVSEEEQSAASSPVVFSPELDSGEQHGGFGDTNIAEYMDEMMDMFSSSDTFGEEEARLLQQPPYVSPQASGYNSAQSQSRGESETRQSIPRSDVRKGRRDPGARSTRRLVEPKGVSHWQHGVPGASPGLNWPESNRPTQSAPSQGESYYVDMFREKRKEREALALLYEELAERYDNSTKLYESAARRYSDLTRRFGDLMDSHEDVKRKFEKERQVHDQVMAVYVTNAVEVEWTRNLSGSPSASRSFSRRVSPRGTVSVTAPTSLEMTASQTGASEPLTGHDASNLSRKGRQDIPHAVRTRSVASSAQEDESCSRSMVSTLIEATMSPEGQTFAQGVQIESFSDFVENQCRSWVTVADFLWSFALPMPQEAMPIGNPSSPVQTSHGNSKWHVPWHALFNLLTHVILILSIHTWLACTKERDIWLYANNIRPTTLLFAYDRGEKSFWPGLHGGLLTGLMLLNFLNSRRVLELSIRVLGGFSSCRQVSMPVLVLGMLMFYRNW